MFHINRFKDKGLFLFSGIILFSIGIHGYLYGFLGTDVDWMSQHTVFPDYFRKLFYETGDLFPNFAANIGAGQNIYHFSYYGLLSPAVLISYLFPHVKMPVFLMAVSLISLAAGCLLFYRWLAGKGFSEPVRIGAGCMFLFSAPLFYHSYKQIMFVNYMPFLCLSLIGVDRYFQSGKKILLTAGVFLMIMSSFYFSVGGIAAVFIYGLHVYLDKNPAFQIRSVLIHCFRFSLPVFTAVLMSGVLVIPTFLALTTSQRNGQSSASLYSLLTPAPDLSFYLYSPYGLGLSSLAVTVLFAGLFYQKRSERFLTVSLVLITLFPVFLYALNGGLYINSKVLIPFLPIVCYMTAIFLQKLDCNAEGLQNKALYYFAAAVLIGLLSRMQSHLWFLPFMDALIMFFSWLVFYRLGRVKLLVIPAILILFVLDFIVLNQEQLTDKSVYQKIHDPAALKAVQEITRDDASLFRFDWLLNKNNNMNRVYSDRHYLSSFYSSCYNKGYLDFRNDVFKLEQPYRNRLMHSASQNPLFLKWMGVKYIGSDYAPAGYRLYKREGNVKIYRNNGAFPVAYVTSRLISEKDLASAAFPYCQELLLNFAAVSEERLQEMKDHKNLSSQERFQTAIRPLALSLPFSDSKQISITAAGPDAYRISARSDAFLSIQLPQPAGSDQVVFLRMEIKNLSPKRDISITVQNERNRLSASAHKYYNGNTVFHFAVTVNRGAEFLKACFSRGVYEISSLEGYVMNAADLQEGELPGIPFIVSPADTEGDVISGFVETGADGFFVTSIPYDEGFTVTLDGKEVPYEKVNTAFLGFPIAKGRYDVELRYEAPGFFSGAVCSTAGFLLFALCIFLRIDSFRMGKLKRERSTDDEWKK